MTMTITSVDQSLRDGVTRQLAWEPDLDASMIGVAAQDGIVTLSGYVDTYAAKLAAERAARKVFGVKAIASELEVRLAHQRIDPEIARDAVEALKILIEVRPVRVAREDALERLDDFGEPERVQECDTCVEVTLHRRRARGLELHARAADQIRQHRAVLFVLCGGEDGP